MLYGIIVLLSMLIVFLSMLLYVASKRLLQFDAILSAIENVIESSTDDLSQVITKDLHNNSPEVLSTHGMLKRIRERMERCVDQSKLVRLTNVKKVEDDMKKKLHRPVVV